LHLSPSRIKNKIVVRIKNINQTKILSNKKTKHRVREAWQKQRESEQLKVNPEEILKEEEKRTNPICVEE
jgi:hypothetical protein